MSTLHDIRAVMLKVIHDLHPRGAMDAPLTQGSVLNEVERRVGIGKDQAILITWNDLFRTGYLAWGKNLTNPNPPFFLVTESGRRALSLLNRDPANPGGYLNHLNSIATLQPVALSYLKEGLDCFVAGLYKAAAVMIGACTESLILDLRDRIIKKLGELSRPVSKELKDWKLKIVLDGIKTFFETHKSMMMREIREEFEAYWMAFTQQIRSVRNEAGHPTSIDPVTPDAVHASLLVLPELAKLADKLRIWVENELN